MINKWRYRAAIGLLIYIVMQTHMVATSDVENTPFGMFLFHGSAALCDLMLIYSFPFFLKGELCSHMETLCIVSIVGNMIGWFAYLAYAPPDVYNGLMWAITYIQWGRLLMADTNDPSIVGGFMVFNNHSCRY